MKSKDEIMMVLKMLQDGKITNEDAAKLIEAIEDTSDSNKKQFEKTYRKKYSRKTSFEEKMDNMAEGLDHMINDVVDATSNAIGHFPEMNFGNWFNTAEKRHFSYKAYDQMKLEITSKNGSIKIYPGNEKIDVVLNIHTKKDIRDIMQNIHIEHNESGLYIDASGVDGGVGIELRIPDMKYGNVKLQTKNGSIRCCPINARDIEFLTKNGSVKFSEVSSPSIKVLTKNGSITAESCRSEKIGLNTTNGSITVSDSETTVIDINTTNGGVRCYRNMADDIEAGTSNASIRMEYNEPLNENGVMNLKTTNGSVLIKIPEDIGTLFKAHAGRNGKVIVNFPCTINESMEYAGKTNGYDKAEKKMNITAKTNLGRIEIS